MSTQLSDTKSTGSKVKKPELQVENVDKEKVGKAETQKEEPAAKKKRGHGAKESTDDTETAGVPVEECLADESTLICRPALSKEEIDGWKVLHLDLLIESKSNHIDDIRISSTMLLLSNNRQQIKHMFNGIF